MICDFDTNLDLSEIYEQKLAEKLTTDYRIVTWRHEKFKPDYFIYNKNKNKTVEAELKVDFTNYKIKNFFFETKSNTTSGRVGGPWSYPHIESFMYYFVNLQNKEQCWHMYYFDNHELLEYLKINKNNFKKKYVENKWYWTEGIIVPINVLMEENFCKLKIVEVDYEYRGN